MIEVNTAGSLGAIEVATKLIEDTQQNFGQKNVLLEFVVYF